MKNDEILIEVRVLRDSNDGIMSSHNFASPEDVTTAYCWPGHGHRHIAHALLTEATRHECFVSLLMKMTADPKLLQTYRDADDETKAQMENTLSDEVSAILAKNLQRLVAPSSKEAFQMILCQSERVIQEEGEKCDQTKS